MKVPNAGDDVQRWNPRGLVDVPLEHRHTVFFLGPVDATGIIKRLQRFVRLKVADDFAARLDRARDRPVAPLLRRSIDRNRDTNICS